MKEGTRVRVTDNALGDKTRTGDEGTIKDYRYSISKWWEGKGKVAHKYTIEFDDGHTETKLSDDIEAI